MKIHIQTLERCKMLVVCLTLVSTTIALSACSGQVKDPKMEAFKKGLEEQKLKDEKEPKLDVIVVNRALKKDEVFTKEMFIAAKLPKSRVPKGALTDPKAAIGHKVAYDMKVGEVLTGRYVSP